MKTQLTQAQTALGACKDLAARFERLSKTWDEFDATVEAWFQTEPGSAQETTLGTKADRLQARVSAEIGLAKDSLSGCRQDK